MGQSFAFMLHIEIFSPLQFFKHCGLAIRLHQIVKIPKNELKFNQPIYETLQNLWANIFDKEATYQKFNKTNLQKFKEQIVLAL